MDIIDRFQNLDYLNICIISMPNVSETYINIITFKILIKSLIKEWLVILNSHVGCLLTTCPSNVSACRRLELRKPSPSLK